MVVFYVVYYGFEGLKWIVERCNFVVWVIWVVVICYGYEVQELIFDNVIIDLLNMVDKFYCFVKEIGVYVRLVGESKVVISLDEIVMEEDLIRFVQIFGDFCFCLVQQLVNFGEDYVFIVKSLFEEQFVRIVNIFEMLKRIFLYLIYFVFNSYYFEIEMFCYIYYFQFKDFFLVYFMIFLGLCIMKLNGSVEMLFIILLGFVNVYFGCLKQNIKVQLIYIIIYEFEEQLKSIIGMDGVSLQLNLGVQGEYVGLWIICSYFDFQCGFDDFVCDICLIFVLVYGMNLVLVVMVGMCVVFIKCDIKMGNLDFEDFWVKCEQYFKQIGVIMIIYFSIFGVFEL